MTDPQTIVAGLQAIKTATDIAKGLLATDVGIQKAELKLKIVDLMEALATARVQLLEAEEEIRTLRNQLLHLQAVRQAAPTLVRRDNVYFFSDGATEEGPFCPRCYEKSKTRMPVSVLPPAFRAAGAFECPDCHSVY
jgi:hypothetical protein